MFILVFRSEWNVIIHLLDKEHPKGYEQALADRIEDKLNDMIHKSRFSQVFAFDEYEDRLEIKVRQNLDGVATLNFRSPEATNKGLVTTSLDRFFFFMFGSFSDKEGGDNRDNTHSRECVFDGVLQNDQSLTLQESPYLQFKSLKPGDKENVKKAGEEATTFSPTCGRHYVEWLWSKSTRTLPEYIAAFAKNKGRGGFYYCGLAEKSSTITQGEKTKPLTTGCIVKALELKDEWKEVIKKGFQQKISEDMLWVQRDQKEGYRFLKPEEVKKDQKVEIKFIRVEGVAKKDFQLYLLEVKVAPFNGVVFTSKNGPEAYELKLLNNSYKPKEMEKETWFEKMSKLGWCSEHQAPKDMRCGTCFLCSECLLSARAVKPCVIHREMKREHCERCKGSENAQEPDE